MKIAECWNSSYMDDTAACLDGENTFTCQYSAGFTGMNCSVNINDCWMNLCRSGGTGTDGIATYSCSCAMVNSSLLLCLSLVLFLT